LARGIYKIMAIPTFKVALVESSKSSGHAGRGIGVYTENLKKYLPKYGVQLVSPDQNPDLIHYPQWDYLSSDWQYLNSSVPTILTIHDVIPLEFPEHYPLGIKAKLNLIMQKLMISHAKFIITDSYASVKSIHRHLSVPHHKLKNIYLGVDTLFKPTNIKSDYHLPKKFALFIGDVNWNKNLVSLTKACLELKLPLVIVGKNATQIESWNLDHPELAHLKELKTLWQHKDIIRLGYVSYEDLNLIMNQASVYCQVSYAEGFGLPVLEAMAVGTPVVAGNTHSLPEICGDTAFFCDPWDLSSIKTAILKALKKIHNKPIKNLSWEKTAQDTLLVYNQALQI